MSETLGGKSRESRLSGAEARILEQFWKRGTSSVRAILEGLSEEERLAYTTVQTIVCRLERKGAVRRVKKVGNAQLFRAVIDQKQFRNGLVRDLLNLFDGSARLLVSNLLVTGSLTLRDLKALQAGLPRKR